MSRYRNALLDELAELPQGWDSRNAVTPTPSALAAADSLVFVPNPDGGIQIELHHSGKDIEIYIEPSGLISGVIALKATA